MNKGYYINGICFNKEQYDLYMDLLIESHNIKLENKQLQAAIRENIVLTGIIYNIKERFNSYKICMSIPPREYITDRFIEDLESELNKTEIYKDKEVKEDE